MSAGPGPHKVRLLLLVGITKTSPPRAFSFTEVDMKTAELLTLTKYLKKQIHKKCLLGTEKKKLLTFMGESRVII